MCSLLCIHRGSNDDEVICRAAEVTGMCSSSPLCSTHNINLYSPNDTVAQASSVQVQKQTGKNRQRQKTKNRKEPKITKCLCNQNTRFRTAVSTHLTAQPTVFATQLNKICWTVQTYSTLSHQIMLMLSCIMKLI